MAPSVRNIRLTLEYDGAHFLGLQKQKQGRTIQSVLEQSLQKILCEPIKIIPSGRTDSGVHARGQVVNFKTKNPLPLTNLHHALNSSLPKDLAVKRVRTAPKDFHARYDAKRKIYSYRILLGGQRLPLERSFSYFHTYPVDIPRMRQAAKYLKGRHDFRSFQASDREKNTVRNLYHITIKEDSPFLSLRFEGNGFLYNMVRNIVGTLLWVGRGKLQPGDMKKILAARDRRKAGPTAPACGLTLERVIY